MPDSRFSAPREDDYNARVLAIVVDTATASRIDGDGYTRATTVVKLDRIQEVRCALRDLPLKSGGE